MVLVKSGLELKNFQSVALSSVFQMSKVLNSKDSGLKLRYEILMVIFNVPYFISSCYPKFDGSIFMYDPQEKQIESETEELTNELAVKVGAFVVTLKKSTSSK